MSQAQRTASIEAVALRWAVQAPRITPGSKKIDHNGFHVILAPRDLGLEELSLALLDRVARDYQAAGFPLRKQVNVLVQGVKGANRSMFYRGYNLIQLLPRPMARESDFYHTVVHEIAHWYHFNQVAGAFGNPVIKAKYIESVRGAAKVDLTQVGNPLDRLRAKRKILEVKREEATKAMALKRGMIVKIPGMVNPFQGNEPYVREYKVLAAPGAKTTRVELLNPSSWDLDLAVKQGWKLPLLRDEHTGNLRRHVATPEQLEALSAVDRELAAVDKERNDIVVDLHSGGKRMPDTRYEELQTDWVPTTYAKQNEREWFAELMCVAILKPGAMKPQVLEWLKTVAT